MTIMIVAELTHVYSLELIWPIHIWNRLIAARLTAKLLCSIWSVEAISVAQRGSVNI